MGWKEIWRRKGAQAPGNPTPADLAALNGYDTGAGAASFEALRDHALRTAARLGVGPKASVLEIGCGAGAFLLPIAKTGASVTGIDISAGHLAVARQAIPNGRFSAGDAVSLPFADAAFDIVIGGACFLYLDSRRDAEAALSEAIRVMKPGGRGVVTDLPDAARQQESERIRRGALGEAEYERLYAGLLHLYFDRDAMVKLAATRSAAASVTTQNIEGYANSPNRFNLWLEKPSG